MEHHAWTDAYPSGDEFAVFIDRAGAQTTSVLAELGLQ